MSENSRVILDGGVHAGEVVSGTWSFAKSNRLGSESFHFNLVLKLIPTNSERTEAKIRCFKVKIDTMQNHSRTRRPLPHGDEVAVAGGVVKYSK